MGHSTTLTRPSSARAALIPQPHPIAEAEEAFLSFPISGFEGGKETLVPFLYFTLVADREVLRSNSAS